MYQNKQSLRKYSLNLITPAVDYIDQILAEKSGMKCLILDEETIGQISLIYTQSQILRKDVYLIERIGKLNKQKLQHMKGIYLIRPTEANQNILINDIKQNRFSEYYVYFTNTITDFCIKKLAEADECDIVKQIQEVYLDYSVVQQDLFTLNMPNTISLARNSSTWGPNEAQMLTRITEGLAAVLFSLRRIPMIRFQGQSEICARVAQQLALRMKEEFDQSQNQFQLTNCMLLVVDRREDPVTPLLNQWTYQAMLHELIGINNNRIDIKQGQKALNGMPKDGSQENEFTLSAAQDEFFAENQYISFGELAQNIKDFIDKVTAQKQQAVNIKSLEDMQKAVDNIPEIRKLSGNLSKHVALSCEISKLVDSRKLLEVSKVEQDLACNEAKQEQQRDVFRALENSQIQNYEKLKLVMLYALRYENCDKISGMKDILRKQGVKQKSLNLINYLIDHAGKSKRQGDLFSNKDYLAKAQSKLKQVFKDVPNIYTQHQPYIMNLVEQIQQNRLKDSDFPTANLRAFRDAPQELIIFQVGGTTYEEAKEVGLLNKRGTFPQILLGGTFVHNSRTYLADLSLLGDANNEIQIDIGGQNNKF